MVTEAKSRWAYLLEFLHLTLHANSSLIYVNSLKFISITYSPLFIILLSEHFTPNCRYTFNSAWFAHVKFKLPSTICPTTMHVLLTKLEPFFDFRSNDLLGESIYCKTSIKSQGVYEFLGVLEGGLNREWDLLERGAY